MHDIIMHADVTLQIESNYLYVNETAQETVLYKLRRLTFQLKVLFSSFCSLFCERYCLLRVMKNYVITIWF